MGLLISRSDRNLPRPATCAAAGCDAPAAGIFCPAHGASKTEQERTRDGDERGQS